MSTSTGSRDMKTLLTHWIHRQPRDLLFVGLLLVCIMLAVGGIRSSLEIRESTPGQGGARPVDSLIIKKQMLDGSLSPRKALFYRKIPR